MNYIVKYKMMGQKEVVYEVASWNAIKLIYDITSQWLQPPMWDGPNILEYYRVELGEP